MPSVNSECHVAAELTNRGEAVNMTLYRLVQEGLTNVARHARASHVAVTIEEHLAAPDRAGFVMLRISDDGVGVGQSTPTSGSGLGLVGMRERVEALGGAFEASTRRNEDF